MSPLLNLRCRAAPLRFQGWFAVHQARAFESCRTNSIVRQGRSDKAHIPFNRTDRSGQRQSQVLLRGDSQEGQGRRYVSSRSASSYSSLPAHRGLSDEPSRSRKAVTSRRAIPRMPCRDRSMGEAKRGQAAQSGSSNLPCVTESCHGAFWRRSRRRRCRCRASSALAAPP